MKKNKLSTAVIAGALALGVGTGTAFAVGAAPAVEPGQSLSSYMNDDKDAEWDKVQTWLEANGIEPQPEVTTPPTEEPSPEPTEDPTQEPTPDPEPTLTESTVVATDDNRIVLTGKLAAYEGEVTFRASAYEFGTQAGYPVQGTVGSDGLVNLEVEDSNNTDPQYWQLELGGSTYTYGEVIAEGTIDAPTTEPTTPPATGEGTTGGTGGALTDRQFQSFTSNGLTSDYHVFASGLDTSKPIGILMWADGTGGYGYDNPNSSYQLGGSNGIKAIAKKHNLVLVTPNAPAPGCDGGDNCWFDSNVSAAAAKAKWSSDLMTKIKGQYNIDKSKVVVGGYSSGAQWTTQHFLPAHGEEQSVDLAVPIAYGGAPRVAMKASAEWKNDLKVFWDTGTNDAAYTSQSWGAVGGYNWYTQNGFDTDKLWNSTTHDRSGDFGPVLDLRISQLLK